MIDGSVKFPGRLQEIKSSWSEAFTSRDYKELLRIAITLYTAIAFSASATDSIYSATTKLGVWFGADKNNLILAGFSYAFCGLGAFAIFPFILYWTQRGIKQITYGGRADASGMNKDPTDFFTFVALVGTIPVILAVLGMVTEAEGMAFGKLGIFAVVLRLSSSLIYSAAAGVPGLSTLFKGIASSCNNKKSILDKTTVPPLLPLDNSSSSNSINSINHASIDAKSSGKYAGTLFHNKEFLKTKETSETTPFLDESNRGRKKSLCCCTIL